MSKAIITPEVTLQLQQVANEISLTEEELKTLLSYETLSILIPFLHGKSSISPYCAFDEWQRISLGTRFKKEANLFSALQAVGVRIGALGYTPVESLKSIDVKSDTYELFCVSLSDIGLGSKAEYKAVEKRARALEIHDGTVPPTLAIELLLNKTLVLNQRRVQYRIFSQPTPITELLGEVVFAVKNGFSPERVDGVWFTEDDPVLLPVPTGVEDDLIYCSDKLIFARRANGRLGHEPRPPRAGMWPIGPTNKRRLAKRK